MSTYILIVPFAVLPEDFNDVTLNFNMSAEFEIHPTPTVTNQYLVTLTFSDSNDLEAFVKYYNGDDSQY